MADPPPAQDSGDEQQLVAEEAEGHHHISDLLEEERQQDSTLPSEENGLATRYKKLAEDELEATSDNGSVDALPRRAGSPADSMLSVPDRSPSVPVMHIIPLRYSRLKTKIFRALESPLPVAAFSHHSPRDPDSGARLPRFDHSTADSSHGSLHLAISLPGRLLRRFCQVIVGTPP